MSTLLAITYYGTFCALAAPVIAGLVWLWRYTPQRDAALRRGPASRVARAGRAMPLSRQNVRRG